VDSTEHSAPRGVCVSGKRGPRVTVGVPFFNEAPWLERAVASVLAQTVQDIEVLLVDDGSTDRSLELARSVRDPRVRVLSDGRRRHLPARLNEIVRHARAPLVARMDADDVAHPSRLERQLALLEDQTLDAVGTWIGLMDEREQPFAVVESTALPPTALDALSRGIFPHATMLARREWLLAHPYDETLDRAEDRDLWCRTVCTSRFAVVEDVLYLVRMSALREGFLPDYVRSQQQNRRLARRYGPSMIGYRGAARTWLASLGKEFVLRAATTLGVDERLVRRRGRPPRAEEVERMREALESLPFEGVTTCRTCEASVTNERREGDRPGDEHSKNDREHLQRS
jgi:glycosyltransferase involved in cell wall biosynthesis